MRIAFLISILMVASVGIFAQKGKAEPAEPGTNSSGQQTRHGISLASSTIIEGELQNNLDVTRAHVGDRVILKVTHAIKEKGNTIVPKGALLVGKVTEITKRSSDNAASRLGLLFDRLESSGMNAPVTASIVSVMNVAATGGLTNSASSDLFGTSDTTVGTGSRRSSGVSGSGGLVGGVTNTVGGVVNTAGQVAGGLTNTVTGSANSATNATASGLNAISISNSTGGSAQAGSVLSVPSRNLRLEKGAMFQITLNGSVGTQ
jgi:hypothetical protein